MRISVKLKHKELSDIVTEAVKNVIEGSEHQRRYVTYGLDSFDRNKFQRIRNDSSKAFCLKPSGGLWASPIDSEWGWWEFVNTDFKQMKPTLSKNICFSISDNAKIMVIDSAKDVQKLSPFMYLGAADSVYINFPMMVRNGYDGMLLTCRGAAQTRDFVAVEIDTARGKETKYVSFNAWDVESLLVFNPDIIEDVQPNWQRPNADNFDDDDEDYDWDDRW